mmetsp:Transcript_23368/g.39913  ORF Transcript_23368/g.39913 Transcript_23368/m.39913 type:complete len:135 (+) Transcript_23368:107-511(+)
MDGTDEEVLERMRDNAGGFEKMTDRKDERLNDGNNYKGLMKASAYREKRAEMAVDPEELLKQKVTAAINKEQKARQDAEEERQQRDAERRERLKQQLASADREEDAEPTEGGQKKKKRKKAAAGPSLSFDADEE